MNIIRFAIEKPVTVMVGVILVALFGMLAVFTLPIQLTPNVDRPRITVQTRWEGASPEEVEREIVNEQEEFLKSVPNLLKMTSSAQEDQASIELEFAVGTDITRSLLEVDNKLQQVPSYPLNVDKPIISSGETQGENAIAWFILLRTENSPLQPKALPYERTLIEEVVKPRLERADEGVANIGIFGGVEREVHVEIDPFKLAARKLTLLDVRDAIQARNIDVSAGTVEEGKNSIKARVTGEFESFEQIEALVLARRDGEAVFLRDVGRAQLGYKEERSIVRALGNPAIAVNATRRSGTNIITVMKKLQAAVEEVNRDLLEPRGMRLVQVYDQTEYIYSSIDLVVQNLWVGGLLAAMVLLAFLRHLRSTFVVALAIPISVTGSFLALTMLGRNLNVVSLAGLTFAVGMVVDNSIVVLENIFRHRQEGKSARRAALDGAREVWGAVLASTLTTLAVFVPVVFIEEDAGQLFRDIAIAISAAVFLSLLVSVLFIPMASARLMGKAKAKGRGKAGGRVAAAIAWLVGWIQGGVLRCLGVVIVLTGAALLGSWLLVPAMSYLPQGNQNLVIGIMLPPPGYNVQEFTRIGERIEERLRPYWKVRRGEALSKKEQRPLWYKGKAPLPGITNFFYVAFGQTVFLGAASDDEANVKPLIDLVTWAASDTPGAFVFCNQTSLFERGISSGNSIDLEITGYDIGEIQQAAGALMGAIMQNELGMPQPSPANFNLGAPEVRVHLDDARAAELDLNVRDLGFMVRAMVDGAIVEDYRHEGVTIDLKIRPLLDGERLVDQLEQIPFFTPAGRYVPLSAVTRIEETTSPDEIRHIEELRAVQLSVTPPVGVELSRAMEILQDKVIAPMRAAGALPPSVRTNLSGTADKLVSTREALKWNFLLAVVITYLLLSALFESFLYPFVILFSVPLAAVGGLVGLRLVNLYSDQQLDVLTMLGFIILVGTVVNNAILIVHKGLANIRERGMDDREAIVDAVRTRVRPIFMSTMTSVLGMAPLVFFPGAGSELYRGLGSVVIGGLISSTIFTLLVVPSLFGLVRGSARALLGRYFERPVAAEDQLR